jgi:hypothetical protein
VEREGEDRADDDEENTYSDTHNHGMPHRADFLTPAWSANRELAGSVRLVVARGR